MKVLFIGLFGLMGVYLRYWMSTYFSVEAHEFPMATFIANSLGCFVVGITFYFSSVFQANIILSGILIGLCGGLTTFSTFNLELFVLLKNQLYLKTIFYALISIITGLILLVSGYVLSSKIYPNNILHS